MPESITELAQQALAYIDECPDDCPVCGEPRDSERLAHYPRPLSDMVAEFHRAANVPVLKTPQVPSDDRVRLRLRLIAEEFFELLDACLDDNTDDATGLSYAKLLTGDCIEGMNIDVDLPEAVDAIIDMNYINAGTMHEFGVNGAPVTAAVHAANMAKFANGVNQRPDGKIIKPEGWTPPDIEGELRKQGWDG